MTGSRIQTSVRGWLLTSAFVLIPAIAPAQAPTKAQQDALRSNCRSDFMRNCSSVTPGGREALECLMRNKANVSAGCQGALNAISPPPAPAAAKPEPKPEPRVEPREPPKAEGAAPPAVQAPAAAAAPHAPETPKAPPPAAAKPAAPKAPKAASRPAAPAPAEAAPPPPAAAAAPANAAPRPMRIGEAIMIRRFCANDFRVLCQGVPMGQGRAVQCLADNRPALSPACKQAMADTGH